MHVQVGDVVIVGLGSLLCGLGGYLLGLDLHRGVWSPIAILLFTVGTVVTEIGLL